MTNAFDAASTFKVALEELYNRKLEMFMCTDSKSLFYLLAGITSPTDKCLLIDLKGLLEAYEVKKVDEISWIP